MYLPATLILGSPHDDGIGDAAALSGRLTYLTMCLTLCWGVLAATGWVRRGTGHQALRTGHVVLASFTLALGAMHGLTFLILDENAATVPGLLVPFYDGEVPHAVGIIGFELLVAVSVSTGLRHTLADRRWLRLHQFAYLAVGLLAAHAWLGAIASGHLAVIWLAGITVTVPPVVLTVLRVLPAGALVRIGLLDPAPGTPERDAEPVVVRVNVDSQRCHQYGVCHAEAPQVFQLVRDGRLEYEKRPGPKQTPRVQAAARACPMRAIQLIQPQGATR